MIRYVRHNDIDKGAWDRDLAACANAHWYGLSTTLDAACPGWDALIDENTGARMPLPWRRKFGILYAYQPFLIQHLGPFAPVPKHTDVNDFLSAVPVRFRFADVQLSGDASATVNPRTKLEQRVNFTLSLNEVIDELRKAYSVNHRRSLRKTEAARAGFSPISVEEALVFFSTSEQFVKWGISPEQKDTMRRILVAAMETGVGVCHGVRDQGHLVAATFFIRWGGRIIFLKGLASDGGRAIHAMHYLIDRAIADHAGSRVVLDLAGTNDPSLARFYQGFGARPTFYLRALVNRLPRLIRLIKK